MNVLKNKFFIFHFSFFILLSCSSVPKEYLTNNDTCQYNDPIFKISKDEMTFDVEKHEKELEKGNFVLINNESFESKYQKWSDNGNITNYQTDKQINIGKWINYYPNGTIKSSTFMYLNGSSEIGKETEYDQQGNTTKVIDYEKGYKICWAEAIEIVKQLAKKDIKKYEIKEFYAVHNNLNEFPKVNAQWYIGFLNGNEKFAEHVNKNGYIRYVIDGVTGKLLKTTRVTKGKHLIYDKSGNIIN